MPNRRLLIDGDALVWKHCEANQEESWWPGSNDTRTATCNVEHATSDIVAAVHALRDLAHADSVYIAMAPWHKENFRNKLWPAYKMHRRRLDSPIGMGVIRVMLAEQMAHDVVFAPKELEADDLLGVEMTRPWATENQEVVMWSPDKDMKQIPGMHLLTGPGDDDTRIITISTDEADYWHLYQTLVGDSSDGYPGCPKVGPVTAQKILSDQLDVHDNWLNVVEAFEDAKLTEEDALIQARVARILRYGEIPGEWSPSGC